MLKRRIATVALLGMMALAAMGLQVASSLHGANAHAAAKQVWLAIPVVPPIGPPP